MMFFLTLLDTEEEKKKFIELYDTYKDLLYWIAFSKVNNIEDAEDCVQETFFYVAKNFNKIGEIKFKRTKCYLSTIVTGFAIDIFNKSNKISFISSDNEKTNHFNDLSELSFLDDYNSVEILSVFDEVLDEESKILLYLKYIYGYKSCEIAEIYNVKDSYIRKKIQYAKEKIKKSLEKKGF